MINGWENGLFLHPFEWYSGPHWQRQKDAWENKKQLGL